MHFVVKYFPEITIKSPPVRKRLIKQLQRNLSRLLGEVDRELKVRRTWDRMDIGVPDDRPATVARVSEVLANTPGIAYFAEARLVEFTDLEDLGAKVLAIRGAELDGKSFCVRAKRSGKHDFNSMDVERHVGAALNRGVDSARVQLKDPQVTVRVEVVDEHCYVLLNHRPGLGGFPLGTQDAVLSLVSGGFDSTVASYMTAKRGLLTHFCFFNLGGRAHELGVKEVSYYLWQKYGASHDVKFVTVPFEGVVSEIMSTIHHSQMGVILKRMMLRVASRVAEEMSIQALVTGESVAQVSSQTLANLSVIDAVTDTLVLRPLVTMDKSDIITLSRKIGTEEFAASMPEYCGVISQKPTTRATLARVEREEANFDWDKLESAFQQRQSLPISAVAQQSMVEDKEVPVVDTVDSGSVVIDIRHPNEQEQQPLDIADVMKIPFYELTSRFPGLDGSVCYLLYCDKGVMSQLHAAHLQDAGYSNVGVYRPAG
ncbi:tRNA uracil 4-sulfurtransferase ThiI [Gilvimarinus sp. F26214L]|uniref:tRNA uracil 4-sulfurtransferase ThiI n=1 Tax=Gilvimarinus sp. DZF01 TaxID=3461371 RepID=UPI00404685C0